MPRELVVPSSSPMPECVWHALAMYGMKTNTTERNGTPDAKPGTQAQREEHTRNAAAARASQGKQGQGGTSQGRAGQGKEDQKTAKRSREHRAESGEKSKDQRSEITEQSA